MASIPHQRSSQHHRPTSPSYQRHTSNVSLSSSSSRQGSPGPASAMSIPTSGIGSDRHSSTSRELDSSERRSLNSSPKHIQKIRQHDDHLRHYSSSTINQQRQLDRNYNRGNTSNNGHILQGANRSESAKQISPSNLHSSPNLRTSSGNVSTASSVYLDKGQPTITKPEIAAANHRGGAQSKYQSLSVNKSQPEASPRSVRISVPPTTNSVNTPLNRQQSNVQQSRWQKLFSSFKKTKNGAVSNSTGNNHGSGPAHSDDAFSLKHSHNCSNSFLKAGISNMKGYKKANQDRLVWGHISSIFISFRCFKDFLQES